jgi:hypothetical protein
MEITFLGRVGMWRRRDARHVVSVLLEHLFDSCASFMDEHFKALQINQSQESHAKGRVRHSLYSLLPMSSYVSAAMSQANERPCGILYLTSMVVSGFGYSQCRVRINEPASSASLFARTARRELLLSDRMPRPSLTLPLSKNPISELICLLPCEFYYCELVVVRIR